MTDELTPTGDHPDTQGMVPIENNSVFAVARGNLAFLLSAIACGERLTDDEEATARRVIERLADEEGRFISELERLRSRVAELEADVEHTAKAALDWQRRAVELGQLSDCNRARIEELEAEHTVIADSTGYTREVEAGITSHTLADHVRHVMDNHRDYINTIRLNVPDPYRVPQLDLCMVRMRDRIAELEQQLDKAIDAACRRAQRIAALEAENGALRERFHALERLIPCEILLVRESECRGDYVEISPNNGKAVEGKTLADALDLARRSA